MSRPNGTTSGKAGAARFSLVKCSTAAVIALLMVPVGDLGAEDNFRMTMTGCQPDSASIQNNACRSGGHGVFASRAGTVCRLVCPMPKTNSSDQWDGLQLFGKDPDGTGPAYRILGHWKTAPLGSPVATTLCSVDFHTGTNSCHRPGFTSFNPEPGRWYWLEVIISRGAAADQEIEVLGYDIF